jgi:hypothetical protein
MLDHYYKTRPPYELGDILVFVDKNENALHSCVFVADDIVFTKNGNNLATPWILMTLEDLSKIYTAGGISIAGWRQKSVAQDPGDLRRRLPSSEASEPVPGTAR